MLVVDLSKRLDRFDLEVKLEAREGATLVLVGESGAGKTTLLRLVSGLDHPDRGFIRVDDRTYFDSAARFVLPAAEREIGYLAQDYALFPHLSVYENVAFGPRARGLRGRDVGRLVDAALARFGLSEFARRRPTQLSGGQQQRVALARALILEPRVLLLDEPLSALDLQTRRTVRGELRKLLAALPCVTLYVTHAPVEALAFGDRIAVLEQGRISQIGTRADLLRHPRTVYVAEFMGLNLLRGVIHRRLAGGLVEVRTEDGLVHVADPGGEGEVLLTVDPREITIFSERPSGTAQNLFAGRIVELVQEPPFGERVRVVLDTRPRLVAEVTQAAVDRLNLGEGSEVYAAFKATGVRAFR